MPTKSWTANPARPKRHRPGKGEDAPSEDEDYSEQEVEEPAAPARSVPSARPIAPASVPARQIASVSLNDKSKINEEDYETESEAEDTAKVAKLRTPVGITSGGAQIKEDDDSGSSEDDLDESEGDESSSSDETPHKLLRPTFVRKDKRHTAGPGTSSRGTSHLLSAQSKPDDPEEMARRKAAADALVKDQLEKQAAARAAGKKYWDDDEDNLSDEIDDTDGLDPDGELAAWKLRELRRVKRARDAIEDAEREREEIERRRNLTTEQREREDREHIEAQKAGSEGKGQAGYLKKYFHKGAFFQDDEIAEELRKRDVMGARFADETNRELLPEYMQIRDMSKLGKKGRTRYKDLRSEDTGRWGENRGPKRNTWDRDERFAPDNERHLADNSTGANSVTLGQRHSQPEGSPSDTSGRNGRTRDERSLSRRPRSSQVYSRSASRSPRRPRSRSREDRYKKRSRSPYSRDRYDQEKRRRIGAD